MTGLELVLVVASQCAAPPVPACSCIPIPPLTSRRAVAELVAGADAVFEGTVVRLQVAYDSVVASNDHVMRWQEVTATVTVRRRWKGAGADTVLVRTPLSTTMCGFDFAEGGRYLIFATEDEDRVLGTTKCSPTAPWGRDARRLARLLGRPTGPSPR